MNYYENQQKEIATIKPRTFRLDLSDADVVRIFEKAGRSGITPEELLENFIGDLVYGTYTNGSDERMAANEWYNRCGFYVGSNSSFLKYLIEFDYIEQAIELLNDIENANDEMKLLINDNDKDYDEDRKYYCLLIGESRNELMALFNEYAEGCKEHESFIDAINAVKNYRQNIVDKLNEEN